ncbi:toll/interleukin-1 receptor domain-containing protein [Leptolyngbyaceae cyanobacterium CCMR0082]|uniref:Toll/interleukin-1 receptor domain-containing protein n=1 Tax=Adonisia turfae CCMR0082 TaxID=2304604 RepID=A0A6M0SDK0_9CYAN|nr:toll/interleukin-1 receptor domain-containing protein [Adonisia turfae]NEZ65752.1 toll/interleukin-1 receptor domain-containing protein [Adonisia turfae CCMR0082]
MANPEHLKILKQGVDVWNRWREENPSVFPDFIDADLIDAKLCRANLINAFFTGADLSDADLRGADLINIKLHVADLRFANLEGSNLRGADVSYANLSGSNLRGAELITADLSDANLSDANLSDAVFGRTVLADLNLSNIKGLETCKHHGPSTIDHRTLTRSGPLPLSFLRGIGLPDTYIDYIPSLFNQPLQFYSCFISYSSKDQEFAERLYADLQNKGVRCWYAPEDLPIGAKIRIGIDEAIRRYDKLLLILSESSVNSQWVEQEVETALEKERDRNNQVVLFPVRLDNAVMDAGDGWAGMIKRTRNIGDFCQWKDYSAYQKSFQRLVRDLKAALEDKG